METTRLNLNSAVPCKISLGDIIQDTLPKVKFEDHGISVKITLQIGEWWQPNIIVRIHDYRASTLRLYRSWKASFWKLHTGEGNYSDVYDQQLAKEYINGLNSTGMVTIVSHEGYRLLVRIEDATTTVEFPWLFHLGAYYEGINIALWSVSQEAPWSKEFYVGGAGSQSDTIRFTLTSRDEVELIKHADHCEECISSDEGYYSLPHTLTISDTVTW